ncbi:MAG: hypothetical protein JWO56_169 [Acidobacteria bacterium]|nr:hypothetical protein [Acidobacteriota bacterium]
MANAIVFQLQLPLLIDATSKDDGGNWQYVVADVVEITGHPRKARLTAVKRENTIKGVSLAATMLTATIMFPADKGAVPANLTIQGVHDIASKSETGSVSSASKEFADYIGGQFAFDGTAGTLTIHPR